MYNIQGQLVRQVLSKKHKAGFYRIQVSDNKLPAGVYLFALSIDSSLISVKKAVLIK